MIWTRGAEWHFTLGQAREPVNQVQYLSLTQYIMFFFVSAGKIEGITLISAALKGKSLRNPALDCQDKHIARLLWRFFGCESQLFN